MKEKPANVMTKDFLPQQDVLGHPNLKAFVTHAGYLSFEESLCHKVPIVSLLSLCVFIWSEYTKKELQFYFQFDALA